MKGFLARTDAFENFCGQVVVLDALETAFDDLTEVEGLVRPVCEARASSRSSVSGDNWIEVGMSSLLGANA